MKRFLIAFIWLAPAVSAQVVSVQVRYLQPCPPGVTCPLRTPVEQSGTGVCIGVDKTGGACILTASHIFDGVPRSSEITVDGKPAQPIVRGKSSVDDVAVLRVPGGGIKPVRWLEEAPQVGESIFACGILSGRLFQERGSVVSLRPGGFVHDAWTNQGFSGGPVIGRRNGVPVVLGIHVGVSTSGKLAEGVSDITPHVAAYVRQFGALEKIEIPAESPKEFDPSAALADLISTLKAKAEQPQEKPNLPAAVEPKSEEKPAVIETKVPEASQPEPWSLSSKLISGAGWLIRFAGLSTPLDAAFAASPVAGVAVWLAVRAYRKRRQKRARKPRKVSRQVEPVPYPVSSRNHYVTREVDRIGEAYREALRRVVAAVKDRSPSILDFARQIEHVAGEIVRGSDVKNREVKTPRPGIWDDEPTGG